MHLPLRLGIAFLLGSVAAFCTAKFLNYTMRRGLEASLRRLRRRVLGLKRATPTQVALYLSLGLLAVPLVASGLGLGPIFGFAGVVFVPFTLLGLLRLSAIRGAGQLQSSSIASLYVLKGLLKAGVGLTSGLQLISTMEGSPFCRALWIVLNRYEKGESMSGCLTALRRESALGRAAHYFRLIEMSYRNGLPIVPLLESLLSFLESFQEMERRVRSVAWSAIAQAVFAAAIPWALVIALYLFDPEIVASFFQSSWVYWLPIPLALQVAGGVLLWRIANFY